MKGDFSTLREPRRHYSRVLKQQGRVELDSDWNEAGAIQQRLMRTLIVDLFGPAAGPDEGCGFGLGDWTDVGEKPRQHDFLIGPGRYYVDGFMIENDEPVAFSDQPSLPDPDLLNTGTSYLAYLDVWERHVTWLQDDEIREVALGGPDTCSRVELVWQVKTVAADAPPPKDNVPGRTDAATERELKAAEARLAEIRKQLEGELSAAQRAKLEKTAATLEAQIKELASRLGDGQPRLPGPSAGDHPCEVLLAPIKGWTSGTMAARLPEEEPADTPCILPIESRYRGLENHLYRIEIHAGGDTNDVNAIPTFKWSRENGSIATRWLGAKGPDVTVGSARGFAAGNWVEITHDVDELLGRPGLLRRVARVEGDVLSLDEAADVPEGAVNPIVRRWDQAASEAQALTDGAIALAAGKGEQGWIAIEDGIEVQFGGGPYRTGDYWLITARVETGAIDWPKDSAGQPKARGPKGIEHHYAPLYMLGATDKQPFITLIEDCRCRFARLPCIGHDVVAPAPAPAPAPPPAPAPRPVSPPTPPVLTNSNEKP